VTFLISDFCPRVLAHNSRKRSLKINISRMLPKHSAKSHLQLTAGLRQSVPAADKDGAGSIL
jgi:hypothetical protein